jgi:hypothetical protein
MPLRPVGYYMYHTRNVHKFYVVPRMRLCLLNGARNKQRLFPYTALTDGCIKTETDCVYRAVRAEY